MRNLVAVIRLLEKKQTTLTDEEARVLGKQIGIDWEAVDFTVAQFKRGFDEELEHGTVDPETNITDDDPEMTGKIAWVHLKPNAAYYDDDVEVDACDYPRTDPMITRGTPGSAEDQYQRDPPQDTGLEPRWV